MVVGARVAGTPSVYVKCTSPSPEGAKLYANGQHPLLLQSLPKQRNLGARVAALGASCLLCISTRHEEKKLELTSPRVTANASEMNPQGAVTQAIDLVEEEADDGL